MGGRKLWVTLVGMAGAMFFPESGAYLTTMVVAFCGWNVAATFAHTRTESGSY